MPSGNSAEEIAAFAWFVSGPLVMIVYPGGRAGWSRVRPGLEREAQRGREPPIVAEKPRLLVIERDTPDAASARRLLAEGYEVVCARTMARALVLLREQEFAGVYVDNSQLSAVRWAGVLIQADEILDAIADGVAVVDPDLQVIWANPEFYRLADPQIELLGTRFYRALGSPEILGPVACPFTSAVAS